MTLVSGDKTSGDLTDCLAPHSLFLFHALFLLSISRPSPVSERLEQATGNGDPLSAESSTVPKRAQRVNYDKL